MAQVDEVIDGIYRISTPNPVKQLQFNQFLIDDDLPALIHTGTYPMYKDVRKHLPRSSTQNAWHTSFAHTSKPTNAVAWDASSQKHYKRC